MSEAILLMLELATRMGALSTLMNTAHAEGRGLTSAELESLQYANEASRADLAAAIAEAKAQGR